MVNHSSTIGSTSSAVRPPFAETGAVVYVETKGIPWEQKPSETIRKPWKTVGKQ